MLQCTNAAARKSLAIDSLATPCACANFPQMLPGAWIRQACAARPE